MQTRFRQNHGTSGGLAFHCGPGGLPVLNALHRVATRSFGERAGDKQPSRPNLGSKENFFSSPYRREAFNSCYKKRSIRFLRFATTRLMGFSEEQPWSTRLRKVAKVRVASAITELHPSI